jgi:septal ring factor EnvC (AmiA/AmiB activator)
MDFLLDPRVWVPFLLGFIGFVEAWSSLKTTNESQTKEIESLKSGMKEVQEKQADHARDIALLQNDHKAQASTILDLVDQLREVVRDLQKVAIKLAIGEHGKTQG